MIQKNIQTLLLVLAAACLLIPGIFLQPKLAWLADPAPMPDSLTEALLDQKSSIGTKEDPQARHRWEILMLRDPATGEIPVNIRSKELAYSKNLPSVKGNGQQFRKAETAWRSAGPYNLAGRTRALGIDVRNEQIILAGGVSGGMWRTVDGGENWVKTTNPEQLQSVTCLVQDTRPGQEKTWYYGSGELIGNSARGGDAPYRGDGIYKSTDGGLSWLPLPATSTNRPQEFDQVFDYIFNLKINPANTAIQELYAAAFGGIYKSIDGGITWTSSLADGRALYTDVEVSNTGVLYASLSSFVSGNEAGSPGLFRSANGGLSWTNITPSNWPSQFGRVVITINPQNPDEVYFLGYIEDRPILWRYNHAGGGGSWVNLTDNLPALKDPVEGLDLQGGYNMVVKVHPQQTQTVFVGGTNLFRSTSGFTTSTDTEWIGGYSPANDIALYPDQHPDQHALVFFRSNPSRAIAGHDGGLSLTENILASPAGDEIHPVDWVELNRGYVTTQFYTVGLDQSQVNDLIIGGMQDNGSYLTPEANAPESSWIRVLGGDGGYTHVANKGAYYYVSFQESQIYRLTLNSEYRITSFARIDPVGAGLVEEQLYLFINPYVFDPNDQNRMYLAAGDVVYRNDNVSQIPSGSQKPTDVNWVRLTGTDIPEGSISAIAISNIPSDILFYGSTSGRLFRIPDASLEAPEVVADDITSPLFPTDGYVAHIAVNPTNANEVIVAFSNYNVISIFRSTNRGETFENISGNLEEFPNGEGRGPSVRHIEIIPLENEGTLYLAGTSTGVYSTRTLEGPATIWEQEAPELIGRVVVPQIRHRSLDGRVVVATHGNGVYFKNYDGVKVTFEEPEPQSFKFLPPSRNPFRISDSKDLKISFGTPRDGTVRIRIYDMKGQFVRLLYYAKTFAGLTKVNWNGRDVAGAPVAPGVYILRMEFEDQVRTQKIVVYH